MSSLPIHVHRLEFRFGGETGRDAGAEVRRLAIASLVRASKRLTLLLSKLSTPFPLGAGLSMRTSTSSVIERRDEAPGFPGEEKRESARACSNEACGAVPTGVGSLKHTMEVDRYAQRCNDWR